MTNPDFGPDDIPLDALAQSDMSALMDSLQPAADYTFSSPLFNLQNVGIKDNPNFTTSIDI